MQIKNAITLGLLSVVLFSCVSPKKLREAEGKMEQLTRPTFITVKQAAAMLGLSEDTLHHLKGGTQKLTRVRFGRAVRMIQQEVEDHIKQRIKDSH